MPTLVTASPELLQQILNSTHEIWSEGLSPADYGRWQEAQMGTPWGRTHLARKALVEGDQWLASAKRYHFTAHIGGERASVLGIGAVFTPRDRRGRGHARDLIDRMTAEAAAEGFRYALLFSEIGPDYYASMGFELLPREDVAYEVAAGDGPSVVSRRGRRDDLPAMSALNANAMTPAGFALERSGEQIEFGLTRRGELAALSRPGLIDLEWLVVEEGGQLAAYVIATRRARGLIIEDCGDLDSGGTRVASLISSLLTQPSFHPPIVRGWIPESFRHWTQTALWRAATDDQMMIKALGETTRATWRGPISYWNLDLF
jgi:GNAT superfamily N-acetyltransferase